MITKLDFVAVPSQDSERSRRFYVCHMAFFTDPDGNDLMLHHRTPRTRDADRCGRSLRTRDRAGTAGRVSGEAH